MNSKDLFYQESGRYNALGVLISYIICVLLALILGYIYSVVIILIPIVYLNFILTIGLSLTLGLIVRFLVRITKNRNLKSKLLLALTFGLLTNYFQWAVYILYAYDGETPNFFYFLSNLYWIIIPENFIDIIIDINKFGLWSIFGIVFTGFGLTIIWLIEAFIIIAGPLVAIYKTKTYPFSELLNKWYPKYTLSKDFKSVSTVNKMIDDLQTEPLKSIQELKYGTGLRHTKIHVFYLNDEENQYLTFENIYIEGRGKGRKNSDIIINNFMIDKITAKSLLDNFDNKKERIEVI